MRMVRLVTVLFIGMFSNATIASAVTVELIQPKPFGVVDPSTGKVTETGFGVLTIDFDNDGNDGGIVNGGGLLFNGGVLSFSGTTDIGAYAYDLHFDRTAVDFSTGFFTLSNQGQSVFGGNDPDLPFSNRSNFSDFIKPILEGSHSITNNFGITLFVGAEELVATSGVESHWRITDGGPSAVIPLPAAGWMMLSAIAGLGLFKARRSHV